MMLECPPVHHTALKAESSTWRKRKQFSSNILGKTLTWNICISCGKSIQKCKMHQKLYLNLGQNMPDSAYKDVTVIFNGLTNTN
jgi:hypothetical protein